MRLAGVEEQEAGVDERVAVVAGVEAGEAGVDWGVAAAAALEPDCTGWGWKKTPQSLSSSACYQR